jgi:hypothetical protein
MLIQNWAPAFAGVTNEAILRFHPALIEQLSRGQRALAQRSNHRCVGFEQSDTVELMKSNPLKVLTFK